MKPAFFILQHGDNNMSHIESVEQLDNVGEVVKKAGFTSESG